MSFHRRHKPIKLRMPKGPNQADPRVRLISLGIFALMFVYVAIAAYLPK